MSIYYVLSVMQNIENLGTHCNYTAETVVKAGIVEMVFSSLSMKLLIVTLFI